MSTIGRLESYSSTQINTFAEWENDRQREKQQKKNILEQQTNIQPNGHIQYSFDSKTISATIWNSTVWLHSIQLMPRDFRFLFVFWP